MKTRRSDEAFATTGDGLKGLLPTITRLLLVLTLFTAGCSHQLTVKNISKYHNVDMNPLEKPLTIGIVSNYAKPDDQKLLNGIATALVSSSAKVLMPYTNVKNGGADVVATIAIRSSYEGSGTNFWINFPGFLVWAPAWNGYIYEVNHAVDVKLANAGGQQFERFTIPISLDVRHADINRTWTEVSWLEFGVIALVGGICFTGYDESVSPLLANTIQQPVGNYISQEIIKRINDHMDTIKVSNVTHSLGK
jgi:hypothetical protein